MEQLKLTIQRLTNQNEKLFSMLPYVLLGISLIACFLNLTSWNLMNNTFILLSLAAIAVLGIVKAEFGYVLAGTLMAVHFMSINMGVACIAMVAGILLAFGGYYGKNSVSFLAIFLLVLNMRNPVLVGFTIAVYGLYCVNRGFGSPLFMSVLTVQSICIYGLFGGATLFPYEPFAEPVGNIFEYVMAKLNDPALFAWLSATPENEAVSIFVETVKANMIFLGTLLLIIYASYFILGRMKREQKEIHIQKTMIGFAILCISMIILSFVISSKMEKPLDFVQLLLTFIGGALGLGLVLFMPNYPVNNILTFAEKQKLEEEEKLSQVVHTVDKRQMKGGWDSIAGYDSVKEELKLVLEPYLDPSVMKKMKESNIDPVKGLLLFGPPGSGKTLFARAIAAESNMAIITVAGSEFTSKWVGESDRNLRNIFEQARMKAPCIIFFDELESFLPKRENANHSWEKTLVTTFLTQMDGFNELNDVLVIGATNYPDIIDPAAIRPGRFDKCIYISTPDVEAKMAILQKYLGDRSILTSDELRKIAIKLERFTAADIEGLIKELYRQKQYESLTCDEIILASGDYKPTVTLDMKEKYESLEKKYSRRLTKDEEKVVKEKKYTWNDIAGMEEAKQSMKNYVEKPLLFAEKYKELGLDLPKGTLLFGPPGCGKTLFAKVVASECNASFFTVNGPELLSGQIGESEKKLRRVFRDAREQKPSIIFFDEFDSIAENRALNNSSVKLINQLLTEMDGMEELNGVLVLAATNRIDTIDPALRRPGRFDNIVYIGLPDIASREKQFALYLNEQMPHINFNMLAQLSEGFSCADIAGVCRKIKEKLLDLMIQGKEQNITQEECEGIVRKTNKTLNDQEIAEYLEMKNYARQ